MRRKYKFSIYLFLTLILSILLTIIQSPLYAINILLAIAIEPIVYFIFTYAILRRGDKKGYSILACVGAVLGGRIVIELPIRIKDFDLTLITILPLVCCVVSIFIAYSYYRYRHKAILIVGGGISIWLYCIFGGQSALLHYINYRNCPLLVNISNESLYKSNNDSLRIYDLKYKYSLLDFWITGCGGCYEKFPTLQTLYNKYNSRKDVFVGSVFVKYGNNEIISTGDSIIGKKKYTFPVLAIDKSSDLLTKTGISTYPTVLILDEKGTVVYVGSLSDASDKLENLLDE